MKRIFKNIITFALGTVTCLGVMTSGFTDWSVTEKQVQRMEESASFIGEVFEGDGFTLAMARAESDEGISTIAETNYTITATVTTSGTVLDNGVTWSMAWANAGSEWATGKRVADYVTISPSGLSCTVSNATAFGEPIIVTATSRQNSTKKAACRLDYVKRILGFEANSDYYSEGGDLEIYTESENTFVAMVEFGVGTVTPSVVASDGQVGIDPDVSASEWILSQVDIDYTITMKEYHFDPDTREVRINFYMSGFTIEGDERDVDESRKFLLNNEAFGFGCYLEASYNGVSYGKVYCYIFDNGGILYETAGSPSRISKVTLDKSNFAF